MRFKVHTRLIISFREGPRACNSCALSFKGSTNTVGDLAEAVELINQHWRYPGSPSTANRCVPPSILVWHSLIGGWRGLAPQLLDTEKLQHLSSNLLVGIEPDLPRGEVTGVVCFTSCTETQYTENEK